MAVQVRLDQAFDLFSDEEGIGLSAALPAGPGQREVRDRGECGSADNGYPARRCGGRQRQTHCQIAASGVARERDSADTSLAKSAQDRATIFDRRWKRMLRGKAVFRDKSGRAGAARNVSDEIPLRRGRSPIEPAAMQVKNGHAWRRTSWLAPPARYRIQAVLAEDDSFRGDGVTDDRIERCTGRHATQSSLIGLDLSSYGSHH